MDSQVTSSPRKARKSMRSQANRTATSSANESALNSTSSPAFSSTPDPKRKQARKSTGTRSLTATTLQATEADSQRSSVGISQNSTIPFSQPSCSKDVDSSTSNTQSQRTRISERNSLNTTVPFSQPGCSKDPDSCDSDGSLSGPRRLLKRKASTSASDISKKNSNVLSSTSEESEDEKTSKKKAAMKTNTAIKAGKSSSQKTVTTSNQGGKPLMTTKDLVNQCVFYILVANRSKKAIKKRDIIQHVFDGKNSQMFLEVLKRAASILKKTFGFELMELKSSKNEYLLVNALSHQYEVQEFEEFSHMERQKQGFIFYILALIYMNENSITEGELWKALDPLGVEIKSRKPHPIFGDVQKLVTNTLVKEMYLERRQTSKDPPQFEITWGERAHKEVLKEDLLKFVCEIMDMKPEEWILQYKDAYGRSVEGNAETDKE